MSGENVESSARSSLRDLFQRRPEEAEHEQLLADIARMLDTHCDVRDVMPLVEQLRKVDSAPLGKRLDQYLLRRIGAFAGAREELEKALKGLRAKLEHLLSPPLFPARFLGTVTTAAGEYAKVSQNGASRLVVFGAELSATDVHAGDEVYLCHERNVVLARAADSDEEIGETAVFVRRTDDGRLVLEDRDAEVVVTTGAALAAEALRPGDSILWDRTARIALGRIETAQRTVGYEEIGATPPQALGGFDATRDRVLDRFVLGLLHPETAREYRVLDDNSRRLLLIGPPGTGKTTLMRTVAARIAEQAQRRCRVATISAAELYSSYVGETERNIRRCFTMLADHEGPGIAFFDELDAIGRARGHASGYHDDRFLGTLLAELEGIKRSDVAVIAATNRADALDPALRGRFAWELEIPRPNLRAARQIFAVHMTEDVPYRPSADGNTMTRQVIIDTGVQRLYEPNADNRIAALQFRDGKRREVAARELVSGRLIEQICAAARSAAFERRCRGGEPGITVDDMRDAAADAIERLRNTLTTQNAKSYLTDLPPDLDVVSVEPIRPRADPARYARES